MSQCGESVGHEMRKLWSVLVDTHRQMWEAQLFLVASSLAYTTILSIIPLLAVSFSIFQAFGGMERMYAIVEPFILSNLAQGASSEAMAAIRRFIGNIHAGTLGATGLIGLIITSMSMLSSAEKSINRIWKTTITRTPFQRIASYWLFITLGPLGLAFALGAATTLQMPVKRLLPSGTGIFLLTVVFFFGIYKGVPNRKVHWKAALIAAAVTACLFNLARIAYALYAKFAVSYDKIYGSLSAIPLLIFWIYILWVILLTGAALTAAIQKRFDIA